MKKNSILNLPDENLDLFTMEINAYPSPKYDFFERSKHMQKLYYGNGKKVKR